ncbi:hypothetical protein BEN49_14505 [Hymenobacter coccineus]|uniref:Metallo-beta-lactamase domain-containing protein n=1 Tax=Hymenobacter coccineus TaxID=1908235 RepID=A0A1G1SU81_9BACT|nr:hypothetical protein BEN49_14505 [Hymenobacter coccineus]
MYWVAGGGSNTGFVIGKQGVVIIDAQQTAADARQVLAEIAKLTPNRLSAVVVTHADPDHVGGLPAYPAGTTIIAQENTPGIIRASAADTSGGRQYGRLYQPLVGFLPTRTIGSQETLVLNGMRLLLLHAGPGHSSADLVVYLPDQRIVFAGDLITTVGPYPVIHRGGSSLGWLAFMKAILALGADTYVGGHGPLETKAQLQARLRAAEERRAQVKKLVDAHKSLAEVKQALPEKLSSPLFPGFTETIYQELTQGYPPASRPWDNLVHP